MRKNANHAKSGGDADSFELSHTNTESLVGRQNVLNPRKTRLIPTRWTKFAKMASGKLGF